jgi:hypothetical protein
LNPIAEDTRRSNPAQVHFIVASCENMIAGHGLRPGDILTASNGMTIEVNNTDAEGRLTLADALVYAEQQGAQLGWGPTLPLYVPHRTGAYPPRKSSMVVMISKDPPLNSAFLDGVALLHRTYAVYCPANRPKRMGSTSLVKAS